MGGEYRREEGVALLVIVVLAGLSLVSLLVAFTYYCYISNKVSKHLKSLNKEETKKEEAEEEEAKDIENHLGGGGGGVGGGGGGGGEGTVVVSERGIQVQLFSYKQLHVATGGFGKGHVVGHGSFGSVYRGLLPDGRKIAVKLMDRPGMQGEEEFKMEVELLTRLRSPYLLGLIGHCSENGHRLLVYEFMANGGLQEHLYPNGGLLPLLYSALPLLTDREKVVQIMDPALEGQYSMKDAVQVAAIAAMCVQPEGDYRPLMADVVQSLVPLVKNRSIAKGCSSSFHASRPLASLDCGKTGS
ncbi:Serine/threonine-protein kinase CDG1 [Ananas comosus]|uniref:Serine/threonine-protein kinase CDG1 n=1 Tax=Ananas comosus TaxID=4615 RepID=A0A199W573_ANACO|nr:Serine/threonine-protein kinase CDG1 [Ananas comosus]